MYNFEVKVSNISRNATQNVAGKYLDSGDPAECKCGFLCIEDELLANEGYTGILNKNTWSFVTATTGAAPHIYACNSYDVNKVTDGVNVYNVGKKTLGLALPANEYGTFTEIIDGELYGFGADNFTTLPSDMTTDIYVAIANGKLVASSTPPSAGDGLCFLIKDKYATTEGAYYAGDTYLLQAFRI